MTASPACAPQFLPFLVWRTAVTLLGTNLPVSRLFGFVFGRSSRFPVDQAVIEAYGAPFPSRLFRGGAARS